MGSTGKAVVTGFICRLCSEQKKIVIHLYTDRARKLRLLEKIKLLPISVEKYDNLPKSICEQCVSRLEAQYDLLQKIRRSNTIHHSHRLYHSNGRCPTECPLHGIDDPSLSEVDAGDSSES
ncbi:uncharacterized protein LOC108911381 [Anoplophora glabripennis]|uniref:ZAD domain-containing protein n=1 Tax=Anoplophora glabripennis TaxID=217634 RepID=V5G8E1_ANOGL|nr:uncharacterized protein LOC108911381 [Anoplophora glabripennis]